MKKIYVLSLIVWLAMPPQSVTAQPKNMSIPYLQKSGKSTQLVVEGKPFLILGGELGNSSASNLDYMRPIWKKMKLMNCNTVLAPVYWELLEPQKGRFDFTLIDSFIEDARATNMKIVFLWFGSWKNSMSCYVPAWVKTNYNSYPRAYNEKGEPQEILTPFVETNLQADANAFRQLMKHIREKDQKEQTVIMIQVENEIGMLPSARDYHPEATKAYNREVPAQLLRYLQENKNHLAPVVARAWKAQGYKTKGTWPEVFGNGLATDEMFIAWYFAAFADRVAEEGKKEYALPMFVNAALNRPNVKPGDYPSGGPLPHLIDIWKAAGKSIDFLSPDFYNPDFKYWNDLYTRDDNPLFIPEIRFEPSVAAKAFYAIGHYRAMGVSPFSIESTDAPEKEPIASSYRVLSGLWPLMMEDKPMDGVLLDKEITTDTLVFGDHVFIVKHDYTLGWSPNAKDEVWPQAGGLVIQTGVDEFVVAGTGIVITFSARNPQKGRVGILNIEEGSFVSGTWTPGRTMNGDQSHQGRHLRFPVGETGTQKLKLYRYR
jgi:beta-galactosidase GanA